MKIVSIELYIIKHSNEELKSTCNDPQPFMSAYLDEAVRINTSGSHWPRFEYIKHSIFRIDKGIDFF